MVQNNFFFHGLKIVQKTLFIYFLTLTFTVLQFRPNFLKTFVLVLLEEMLSFHQNEKKKI